MRSKGVSKPPRRESEEEKGRLSNPVQRRLTAETVDELVRLYLQGLSMNQLATLLSIHRTTVIHHLEGRGVSRRRIVRKLTNAEVTVAADRYAEGLSLASVAAEFDVHESTLAREFLRAGVATRSRRKRNS
jgi:AraC-like DNA-binding protein